MTTDVQGLHDGWRSIGAITFRLEPPDILFSRTTGAVTEDDIAQVFNVVRELAAGTQGLFWLSENSRYESITAEARKLAAGEGPGLPVRATLVFGLSFTQRVLTTLIVKMAQALRPAARTPALHIFESEAEARAWLKAHRGDFDRRAVHGAAEASP